MILEVASGNFSYRIARSGRNDHLETVVVLLNMMAEEIRESFHHFAHINPHETYHQIAQMSFILDEDFRIQNYNSIAQQFLGLQGNEMENQFLENFLTPESRLNWNKEILQIKRNRSASYFHTLKLIFNSANSLMIPAFCSVSKLSLKNRGNNYLVTAIQTIVQSQVKEDKIYHDIKNLQKENKAKRKNFQWLLYREADKKQIQEVYDYILKNLKDPLPSLKQLAHNHGMNEFKLKVGFRQLYNTTVFRFQKEQRLSRAHHLIRTSDLSLGLIAEIYGFKSFPHFSKTFKTKYGYNPSELRNRNLN